jgi:hypothetical protein
VSGPARTAMGSRAVVGLVMGAMALALAWILLSARWGPVTGGIAATMTVAAVTVLAVSRPRTVRRAWAWMCLIDGLLSAVLAVSTIAARGAPSVPGAGYQEEIRRTIGPMPPMGRIQEMVFAATAVLAAFLLIVFGLWMLYHDRHHGQRDAP